MNLVHEERLFQTQLAFDAVASEYDGPSGNNELIQYMRSELMSTVMHSFPPGSHLLDLGCGTGLDAALLANRGYRVTAIDSSSEMVAVTRRRVEREGLSSRVRVNQLGIQELERLDGSKFDGVYSGLGALNCAPNLREAGRILAYFLPLGGLLVSTVIGRHCPWEILYFGLHGRFTEARRRQKKAHVPVRLRTGDVWTRYFTPQEFRHELTEHFSLESYRALCVLAPPPYLVGAYRRLGYLGSTLTAIDAQIGGWPMVRNGGDHFLAVVRKHSG